MSNGTQGTVRMDHKAIPSKASSVNRRAMSVEEKPNLVKDLEQLLSGKMIEKLQSILQEYNLCSKTESFGLDIAGIDNEILWELKRFTSNSLLKVAAPKTEPAKVIQRRILDVSRVSCSSARVKPPARSMNSNCGSCDSFSSQYNFFSNKVQLCKMTHPGVSRTDCYKENSAASCNGRFDPGANGSGSVVEEAASVRPDKETLFAAGRFADTIFKAKIAAAEKEDLVKLQLEKDKLERNTVKKKLRLRLPPA